MEVILLEKVNKLGNLGDKVRVRPGFARNYLLPQGKAKMATPENLAEFEAKRAELERKALEAQVAAESRRGALADTHVVVQAKAGVEGKLFGSVAAGDIAEAISASGVEVARREIQLPDGPLRAVGEYEIEVHLAQGVTATVKVTVEPQT